MHNFGEVIDAPTGNDQVVSWITEHLKQHKFLLAFADDGVIWGRMGEEISTKLRGKTLQQAFIFDDKEEVRLFRDEMNNDKEAKWQARKVVDGDNEVITESQILWGDESVEFKNGFLQVKVDTKGISNQIIPAERKIIKDKNTEECLRLEVHHIVAYNNDGEANVKVSRLAGLRVGNKNEEVAK